MSNYLEQIVFNGFVEKEFTIKQGDKEVVFVLTTLSHEHQKEIDDILANIEKPTGSQFGHVYLTELLIRTLKSFDKLKFTNQEMCRNFLNSRPTVFIKMLAKKQSNLEKEVKEFIDPEQIEENFSQTPLTTED